MLLFLFLNYCLFFFLIPAIIAQIFHPNVEIIIPIRIQNVNGNENTYSNCKKYNKKVLNVI